MIVPRIVATPVVLMLKNTLSNKYHPIFYWECPLPAGQLGDHLRWKSKGHHTTGFDNRDEAVSSAMELVRQNKKMLVKGDVYYMLDEEHDTLWDGSAMPADVATFNLNNLTKYEG